MQIVGRLAMVLLGVAFSSVCVHASSKERSFTMEESESGDMIVQARVVRGHWLQYFVVHIGSRRYRFLDERVGSWADGRFTLFNDDPGDCNPHSFGLSPDKRWLCVSRKCASGLCVCYLYHRKGLGNFVPVHPCGKRFDEAAIDYFVKKYHAPRPTQSLGGEVADFGDWDKDGKGVTFDMTLEHRSGDATDKGQVAIVAHYAYKPGRFRVVNFVTIQ